MPINFGYVPNLGTESPLSIAPIQQWRNVVLDENFVAKRPQSQSPVNVACRAINCNVDMNQSAADRTITYAAITQEQLTFVVNTPGEHPFNALGIYSVGAGIDPDSLQWGV